MRCTDYAAVARAMDDKLDRDTLEYLDMRDEERREREDEGDAHLSGGPLSAQSDCSQEAGNA